MIFLSLESLFEVVDDDAGYRGRRVVRVLCRHRPLEVVMLII